jgi:two-component system response regulator
MQHLLTKCRFPIRLRVVCDGEEALKVLHQSTAFDNNEDPDIIFLDLNLPKIDGQDVLTEVKAHQRLKNIPVLILSSSNDKIDIDLAMKNRANGYLVKPLGLEGYSDLSKAIEGFWFKFKGVWCNKSLSGFGVLA